MAKPKSKKRRATAGKGSVDRHVFSTLVGLALGACVFYAKRAVDSKSATA